MFTTQQPTVSAPFSSFQLHHHCMMDGYDGNMHSLDDTTVVQQFLINGLPQGASLLAPYILYFDGEGDERMKGVTGCFLGFGAHMTVHTYSHEEKRCFFYDSFGLNIQTPRALGKQYFATQTHDVFYANRGELPPMRQEHSLKHYGPHLLLSGSIAHTIHAVHVLNCLQVLPKLIEMTPLIQPLVLHNEHSVSGLLVIAESHIAIHVDNRTQRIDIDVFSCKPFAVDRCIQYLTELFHLEAFSEQLYLRGLQF